MNNFDLGATVDEVNVLNFLSVNLHLMMVKLMLRLLLIKTNDKFIILIDFILSTN